jgi:hypothetical protein
MRGEWISAAEQPTFWWALCPHSVRWRQVTAGTLTVAAAGGGLATAVTVLTCSVPFEMAAQTPGARSPGLLTFVWWRLAFVGH